MLQTLNRNPGLLWGLIIKDRKRRILRDASALSDRARRLYEEMGTRIAANADRSLKTLMILSTLLLPSTLIAGAFGMNVPAIPWANDHGGFWWAIGLCGVVVAGSWWR